MMFGLRSEVPYCCVCLRERERERERDRESNYIYRKLKPVQEENVLINVTKFHVH